MPRPMTRVRLDMMRCGNPDCTHADDWGIVLRSRCHPAEPTWAVYDRSTGTLEIRCASCDRHIVTVEVK